MTTVTPGDAGRALAAVVVVYGGAWLVAGRVAGRVARALAARRTLRALAERGARWRHARMMAAQPITGRRFTFGFVDDPAYDLRPGLDETLPPGALDEADALERLYRDGAAVAPPLPERPELRAALLRHRSRFPVLPVRVPDYVDDTDHDDDGPDAFRCL